MEMQEISGSNIIGFLGGLVVLFTVFRLLTPTLKFVAKFDDIFIFFCNKKWVWPVKLLLKFGANSNAWKIRGRTVLINASAKGQGDLVLTLLEKGAKVNWQDCNGYTALMMAAEGGYSDTVDILITKKADVNLTTRMGRTALVYALKEAKPKNKKGKRDYSKTVDKLLKAGAKKLVEINGEKKKVIDFLPKYHVLDDDTVRRLR